MSRSAESGAFPFSVTYSWNLAWSGGGGRGDDRVEQKMNAERTGVQCKVRGAADM
jgi:hypothetical protein